MSTLLDVLGSQSMYDSTIRFAVVLAFAATGEWVAERAGTLNISVEAMLIAGAYSGAALHAQGLPAAAALGGAALGGLAVAFAQANLSHRLGVDQFVVGLTLNLFILGTALFLDSRWEAVTGVPRPSPVPLLSRLPIVGDALFAQPWPMYLVAAVVPLAGWLVLRTTWGLEVRAAGEAPAAADAAGVAVNHRRRQAVLFCGACAGLGGGVLVLGQIAISGYEPGHVGLKGIIAIAAVVFGGWRLRGALAGCLLFGWFFALQQTLPVLGHRINAQLAAALPYLVALAVTAAFAGHTRQPGGLGRPFVRSAS